MSEEMRSNGKSGKLRIILVSLIAAVAVAVGGFAAASFFGGELYAEEGSAAQQLRSSLADPAVKEITLDGTVQLLGPVEVNGEKTILGTGRLKAVGPWAGAEQDYILVLSEGAAVTLAGAVTVDGNGRSGGVYVADGASLTVKETAGVANGARQLANVRVLGELTMAGGTLADANGHNLLLEGSALLGEGEIRGSGENFAGIFVTGDLEQSGGTVKEAYDNVYVAANGTFLWTGGSNLKAENDGIAVSEGGFLNTTSLAASMQEAGKQGIHLYGEAVIDDVFIISSGENQVKIEPSGHMTLNNGAFDGSYGHGITNRGTLIMTGGEITKSAQCGIVCTGTLEITGGRVYDSAEHGIHLRNGSKAKISGNGFAASANYIGVQVEENAYAEVSDCNINSNTLYNFGCYGELYLHDLSTGGSGSNCISTHYGGHVVAENIVINGTSGNNGIYNCNGSVVELKNVTIDSAKSNGIRTLDATLTAQGLTVTNCGGAGISMSDYDFQGAGSVKLEDVTMDNNGGANIAMEFGCTGAMEVIDASLGKSGSNNISAKGGHLILTDVDILGNIVKDASNHGILLDYGCTITATNLKICDTLKSGMRVRGGNFEGTNVTMENIGLSGISSVTDPGTKNNGNITITGLTITNADQNCVISECDGNITVTNGTFGATKSNNVRVQYGTVTLNNVKIQGQTSNPKSAQEHGVMIDGGKLVVSNVTISNAKSAGIRHKGGVVEGKNLTISNAGAHAISMSDGIRPGSISISGLTTQNAGQCNIHNDGSNSITVNGGNLYKTTTNNVRIISGSVTLKNLTVHGQDLNKVAKDANLHGVFIDGGSLNMTNVIIQNTDAAGLRFSGGKVNSTGKLTIKNTGSSGIYITSVAGKPQSQISITNLTIQNAGDTNITNGGNVKLTVIGGDLHPTNTNNVRITQGEVYMENVTVHGQKTGLDKSKNLHAVFIDNGKLTMKNVTVQNAHSAGLRFSGGSVEADGLTIQKAGADGIYMTGGSLTGKNVTLEQMSKNIGLYVGGGEVDLDTVKINASGSAAANNDVLLDSGLTGTVKLIGLEAGKSLAGNVVVRAGTLELKDAVLKGTADSVTPGHHGLHVDGGSVIAETLTVSGARDAVYVTAGSAKITGLQLSGLKRHGAAVGGGSLELKDSSISDVPEYGVNIWGKPTVTLQNVTVSGSGKDGVLNGKDGTLNIYGGYIYGNTGIDVNNAGSLTVSDVTVGYDASGNDSGGAIKSSTVIRFAGDKASSKPVRLDVSGKTSGDKLVQLDSAAIATALSSSFTPVNAENAGIKVSGDSLYLAQHVARIGNTYYETLDAAVAAANGQASATIILLADVSIGSELDVTGNVTITDDGTAKTITRTSNAVLFDISGTLTVTGTADGMIVIDGANVAATGKAFNIAGKLNMTNVDIKNLKGGAWAGNSVFYPANGSLVTFSNVDMDNCSGQMFYIQGAAAGGAAHSFTNCDFTNIAGTANGSVFNSAPGAKVTVVGCTFENVKNGAHGGVIYVDRSEYTITDSVFKNNSCGSQGGGAITVSNQSGSQNTLNLTNCRFIGNSAGKGGAIWLRSSTKSSTTVTGCTFENNSSTGNNGGAILADDGVSLSVDSCSFSGNTASTGKGNDVYVYNTAAASKVTFQAANTKTVADICVSSGSINIADTLVQGSKLTLTWETVPTGTAVQFDSAAAAQANLSGLALGSTLSQYILHCPEGSDAAILIIPTYVAQIGDTKYMSFDEALAAANKAQSATVKLLSNITVSATLNITGNVTLTDDGTARTILRNTTDTMFNVTGSLTFSSTGGADVGTDGKATGNASKLILDGNSVNGASAVTFGSGVTVTVNQGVKFTNFKDNTAGNIFLLGADTNAVLDINGGVFANNVSTGVGAVVAVYKNNTMTIDNAVFDSNASNGNCAVIYMKDAGTHTITNSVFTGNSGQWGGALYTTGTVNLTVSGCSFANNSCGSRGSVISAEKDSTVSFNNCTFQNNGTNVVHTRNNSAQVSVNGTVISVSGTHKTYTDAQLMAIEPAANNE